MDNRAVIGDAYLAIQREGAEGNIMSTGSLSMLKSLVSLTYALVIVAAVALVPAAAKAQTAGAPAASAAGGFDAYRAAAITAGVIGGAVVATVITDGLIVPIIMSGNGGMANVATQLISVGGTVFGAVAGAMYADDWYSGK